MANRLKTTEYGIKKKAGAKAVYMLLGPTGVGKTETVKALSQLLRTNQQLIRIDMGEYKEAHMASKILGSPPGYVGYDNNLNVLEIISKNPDSFILIDEIEKAHPSVVDLFLHMFDEGKAKSSHQKTVDLSNNVFFITSNIGAEEKAKNVIGFSKDSEPENKVYLKSLKKHFRPEFINRINETVIFNSLTYESVYDILNLQLREMEMAFLEEKDIKLNITLTNEAYLYLINGMDYSTYGAREIKRTIEKYILNGVIDYLINTNSKEVDLIFDIEETELLLKPIKKEIMKKQLTYNKI
ncbi:MAG: AAA family ATPase [Bacilli bacterium]|nr:AAA family ATPase [Bacilli bacterium]